MQVLSSRRTARAMKSLRGSVLEPGALGKGRGAGTVAGLSFGGPGGPCYRACTDPKGETISL